MAKIVIVDDHPLSREGLSFHINGEPGLEVCGEAADIPEALQVIQQTAPDLVIIDMSLQGKSGLTLIEKLQHRPAPPRILVWSMFEDSLYADRVLRAGAMGYINKQAAAESILTAIRRVLSGKVYVSDEMSEVMLNRMVQGKQGLTASPIEELSDRELETFQFIGHGLATKEIAHQMNLSVKTIETYRARIKSKLDVHSMAELTRMAAQWVLENG